MLNIYFSELEECELLKIAVFWVVAPCILVKITSEMSANFYQTTQRVCGSLLMDCYADMAGRLVCLLDLKRPDQRQSETDR
jgi:predicted metalloenzyme YecM